MSQITLSGNSINDSMKNIITDSSTLANLANQNLSTLAGIQGFNINNSAGIKTGLDSILSSTPLKAGCCMRNQYDNTG